MDEEKQGYLSVGELSGELNVKPSWVYGQTRMKGQNRIPHLRVGKYYRFLLPDVLEWLKTKQNACG